MLVALLSGLGYGGWLVLQNIQRVQFAPVEDLPVAVAEVDLLAAPDTGSLEGPDLTDLESPVAATALAPSTPTPGTVAMRRARSFDRYQASNSRSSWRMRLWASIACSAKSPIV